MLFNINLNEKISEQEFRSLYPNTSFPVVLTDELLAEFGFANLQYATMPQYTNYEKVVESDVKQIDGKYVITWEIKQKTPEEIAEYDNATIQSIINAVQLRLDDFARSRNYDNILSACSYATSGIPKFAGEGQYCVQARDNTWLALYKIMDEIRVGTRPMPINIAAIESDLPVLSWSE